MSGPVADRHDGVEKREEAECEGIRLLCAKTLDMARVVGGKRSARTYPRRSLKDRGYLDMRLTNQRTWGESVGGCLTPMCST